MSKTSMGEICLLNDSFPPALDGVANAVVNYAKNLPNCGFDVSVVTPEFPGSDDSSFSYPVYRYPSIDLRSQIGYTAGIPISLPIQKELQTHNVRLLHSHCPAVSNIFARQLRETLNVPLVMTYHTKYDVDISNTIHMKFLKESAIKALVESVSACDELWVVSHGAGENIRSLGYQGDYVVMPNGVDLPKQKASLSHIKKVTSAYDLPESVPTFLFVGRLMWYKGIRTIADALAALKYQGFEFRMVFVGKGTDEKEIKSYITELNLDDKCFFIGALQNREDLTAWYTRADLMLFPSTFDTNGLVVREAAACSLGSVLIADSCAAEGVTNFSDALLIQDSAASLALCLASVMNNRDKMHNIGEHAAENLYFPWKDSVIKAAERYEIVIENYKTGKYKRRKKLPDDLFAIQGALLDADYHLKKLVRSSLKKLPAPYVSRKKKRSR